MTLAKVCNMHPVEACQNEGHMPEIVNMKQLHVEHARPFGQAAAFVCYGNVFCIKMREIQRLVQEGYPLTWKQFKQALNT